jgi:hypothetical protein
VQFQFKTQTKGGDRNTDKTIKAGVSGFILAIIINLLLSSVYLYFLPSFLAAIIAVYFFRLENLKDGLVVAFMTYIFNDAVLATAELAWLYSENKPYSISVDIYTVFSPIINAVTALIAGYVAVRLVRRMKPSRELPSPLLRPPST